MSNYRHFSTKATAIFVVLFLSACIAVSAQRNLTPEEIIQYHKTSKIEKRVSKDSTKLTWSDELNIKLYNRIAILKSSGIDSLIVYSVSYPGYAYRIDSCTSRYSTSAYLLWKSHGTVTIEKFKGACEFIIDNKKAADIFSFYDTNYTQLKDEIFMPVIFSGQISDSNKITYQVSLVFHEAKYSLYYDIGASYNSFTFGQSELADKKSMFYNYNLDLAAYHWWKLISEQVTK